jgi:hypothetical protein
MGVEKEIFNSNIKIQMPNSRSCKHTTRLRAETHSGVQARTRLRTDLPTPAEAGFGKAGALLRAGTVTLFSE